MVLEPLTVVSSKKNYLLLYLFIHTVSFFYCLIEIIKLSAIYIEKS